MEELKKAKKKFSKLEASMKKKGDQPVESDDKLKKRLHILFVRGFQKR
jgi:hypothetical protein